MKYDVIHIHSVPDPLVFTAFLPKLVGAKIILDIHDLLPELYASKFGVSLNSLRIGASTRERACRFRGPRDRGERSLEG